MGHAPLQLFGSLALRHDILKPEQLRLLLDAQEADPGTPMGELARRRGLLTARQIRYLLDLQRGGAVDPNETVLGTLALENGFVSPDEVYLALEAQRGEPSTRPLGEILMGMGALEIQQCGALLMAQRRLRGIGDGGELDYETRLLPVAAEPGPAPGERPEPQGWLIQETGDDLGHLFPLGPKSVLGRLPEQDVPVPDMAASRDHAVIEYVAALLGHVIRDLDSRNGTFVNGAQLLRPRPLQPGDRVQIGSTVLRYVTGGGIGGGQTTIVTRLGRDAARVARGMASLIRKAASAADETAHRLLSTPRHRRDHTLERRDALLEKLATAFLAANPDANAVLPVRLAERRQEEARLGGDAATILWAERRRIEAVRMLGQSIVDRGPAPDGWMKVIVEIRELNAEIAAAAPS
ncbi:MAG TPA: FHA domain-containing protein [Planctomycetota bacterium]